MATRHLFRITIHRDDRPEPVDAGTVEFHGQDYDTFDSPQARAALVADGRLQLGPQFVQVNDVIVPVERVDRVVVSLEQKSQ